MCMLTRALAPLALFWLTEALVVGRTWKAAKGVDPYQKYARFGWRPRTPTDLSKIAHLFKLWTAGPPFFSHFRCGRKIAAAIKKGLPVSRSEY